MEDAPARTFSLDSPADWLAGAGIFLERVWRAVQAFGGALRKEPVRARGKRRRAGAELTAVPRPSPPKEPEGLPETYGRTKVVAMVVSPYLVHVYWDLAPPDGAPSGPASLRFHDLNVGTSFDVNVDLAARNWYVHLWSPERRYTVELGREQGAAFTPLARSNPIETPRAWPVAEVDRPERALAAGRTLPAEPEPGSPPRMQPAPTAQLTNPTAPPPLVVDSSASVPTLVGGASNAPPAPGSATHTLQERLAELYRFRRWPGPPVLPDANGPAAAESTAAEPTAPESPEIAGPGALPDLTARLESQFSPGLSSGLLGNRDRSKPIR